MSFELTNDVAQQLKSIPNLDKFVNDVIQSALQKQNFSNTNEKVSKWALLANEISSNPTLNLDGYSEQLKKDSLEIRENLFFSNK